MANELLVSHNTGTTVYAVGRLPKGDNIGQWGNVTAGATEVFNAANWVDYVIALVELGNTGLFEGDMPALFNSDVEGRAVEIIYLEQLGVVPVEGDTKVAGSLFELMDEWVASGALRV